VQVGQLAELIADAHFSISVDTHTMTADMQAAMRSMQADIKKQTAYAVGAGGLQLDWVACRGTRPG